MNNNFAGCDFLSFDGTIFYCIKDKVFYYFVKDNGGWRLLLSSTRDLMED